MTKYITNPQGIKIERREWYDSLQHDISPHFRPSSYDAQIARCLVEMDNSPEAINFFAAHCGGLTDYAYWFYLGVCWVQYTGWSDFNLWKSLFSSGRPNRAACLMKPTELRYFKALPKDVHCYRVHRPKEKDWLSYTLDLQTAKKLAAFRNVSHIHEYRIPRKRLLCLFLRRHEDEILCLDKNSARLKNVIQIRVAA